MRHIPPSGAIRRAFKKPGTIKRIITYVPPDRVREKLSENVVDTGRTASDLIDSALAFYFDAAPKEYPDKAPRPLPMHFMLANPDGHFYDVGVGENSVSGLFEGTAKDFAGNWHTLAGIEWEVSHDSFFGVALSMGLIDYLGYLAAGGETVSIGERDYNARQWATDWLTENVATEIFYRVLANAYRTEFSHDLGVIAYRMAEFHGNPARLWGADLKTAVLELAGLFRACEGWPIQGV